MLVHKLSILVPAYNEEKTISEVLTRLAELELPENMEKEVIVVNDCSKDHTGAVINEFISKQRPEVFKHFDQPVNQGKGAAIHKAIELSTGDYIVIQDADLELNPSDILLLLAGLKEKNAEVIYGSRFLNNTHQNTNFLWHIMGNGFLTRLSNLFTGFRLTDMMTCYKLIPAHLIKAMQLKEKRFGFEPEVTLRLSKIRGLRIAEVPISYVARSKTDGKKINYKDGLRVIYCILKYKFSK
jgi:glycosyltransferase involved in cell wall biosynthesis